MGEIPQGGRVSRRVAPLYVWLIDPRVVSLSGSLAARHKASSVALAGAVAQGDDTDADDYEFLADLLSGATLFGMAGLRMQVEDLPGTNADALDDRRQEMRQDAITLQADEDCDRVSEWRRYVGS